jgi:hypothetical protein
MTRNFAELQIDCGEDRRLQAALVGMLREADGSWRRTASDDSNC